MSNTLGDEMFQKPGFEKRVRKAKVFDKFPLLLKFWDLTNYFYEWEKAILCVFQYDLWNDFKSRSEKPFFLFCFMLWT